MVTSSNLQQHVPFDDTTAGLGRGAQSERAFATIRSKILLGELQPGCKLRVESLEAALGLSSTPVREALNRLTTEGLVKFEENRGFRAAPLSASDLRDITRLRIVNEADALADAISFGNDEWEAGIVAAHYRLNQHEKKIDGTDAGYGEQWTALHKAFHMALIGACTYPRILAMCEQLFDQSERYRRFAVKFRASGRNVRAEHDAIMDATLTRDKAKAIELHCSHLQSTGDGVSRILSERQQFIASVATTAIEKPKSRELLADKREGKKA
jgi:DNA-binding GntR family transcriptional regulator